MNYINPFHFKEVQTVLLLNSDLNLLKEFYVRYPELRLLLSEPSTLKALCKRDKLPYKVPVISKGVKSIERLIHIFEDYVFYSKFKDVDGRRKMPLRPIRMLLVGIKIGYSDIYDELVEAACEFDNDYYLDNGYEIAETLAKYSSETDIKEFSDVNSLYLVQSLAKHHRNDIFWMVINDLTGSEHDKYSHI